jgi:glutathione S-transferase
VTYQSSPAHLDRKAFLDQASLPIGHLVSQRLRFIADVVAMVTIPVFVVLILVTWLGTSAAFTTRVLPTTPAASVGSRFNRSTRTPIPNADGADGFRSNTALQALTIYGHPGSRSPLVNWACIELNVDYSMGDLSNNPHPFRQLPCLTNDDEDVVVFESGAILQYLLRYYGPPSLTKEQIGAIMSWITWANASLDPICFLETPDGKVYDTGLKQPNRKIDQLNELLGRETYLVEGAGFTLADVAVSSYLLYVLQFFPNVDLSRWPNLVRYMTDCASRPGYGQAFGEPTQASLVQMLSSPPPSSKDSKLFGMF